MSNIPPAEISAQLDRAQEVIRRHLEATLLAVHLYGSALDGGLMPYSDIDLLVTVDAPLEETVREALMRDLLTVSAPPGQDETLRALEVTVVVLRDIVPWFHPSRRELQFGEWLRGDISAGRLEPPVTDPDLTILLIQTRQRSVALTGPSAADLFDPIPDDHLLQVLASTLKLWNSPPDWAHDERNVLLTLARIWYSASTGKIVPKNIAADWALERLPAADQPALHQARQAYLGLEEDRLASRTEELAGLIRFMKTEAVKALEAREGVQSPSEKSS